VGKFLLLLGGTIALRPYVFIFLMGVPAAGHLAVGGRPGRSLPDLGLAHLLGRRALLHPFRPPLRGISIHPGHPGPGTLGSRGPSHGPPVLRINRLCQLLFGPAGPGPGALAGMGLLP